MHTPGVIAPRLLLTRCATTSRPAKNRRSLGRAGRSWCGPISTKYRAVRHQE